MFLDDLHLDISLMGGSPTNKSWPLSSRPVFSNTLRLVRTWEIRAFCIAWRSLKIRRCNSRFTGTFPSKLTATFANARRQKEVKGFRWRCRSLAFYFEALYLERIFPAAASLPKESCLREESTTASVRGCLLARFTNSSGRDRLSSKRRRKDSTLRLSTALAHRLALIGGLTGKSGRSS